MSESVNIYESSILKSRQFMFCDRNRIFGTSTEDIAAGTRSGLPTAVLELISAGIAQSTTFMHETPEIIAQ
jgi:hypothetical protein